MKIRQPGTAENPKLYRAFGSAQEIADTINRSRAYVFKAIKQGFTAREREMLEKAAGKVLFDHPQTKTT